MDAIIFREVAHTKVIKVYPPMGMGLAYGMVLNDGFKIGLNRSISLILNSFVMASAA